MKYNPIIVVEDPGIQIEDIDSICPFREELMLGLGGVISGINVFFSLSFRKPWSAENEDDDRV